MNKKKGFTLIELLVVIAILAILIAFVVTNFAGAMSRARDLKKKSEFQQIKSALRLYYNDYARYPGPSTVVTNTFEGCGAEVPPVDACDGAFSAGATVYMKLLPSADEYEWNYQQMAAGDDFCLWTNLEGRSDAEISRSQARCSSVCSTVDFTPATDYIVCAD